MHRSAASDDELISIVRLEDKAGAYVKNLSGGQIAVCTLPPCEHSVAGSSIRPSVRVNVISITLY